MTNVNVSVDQLLPQAGSDLKGRRFALLSGAAKAAQNDTITLVGATKIVAVIGLVTDTAGAAEGFTFATNVLTLTSATTGTVSGIVVYQ